MSSQDTKPAGNEAHMRLFGFVGAGLGLMAFYLTRDGIFAQLGWYGDDTFLPGVLFAALSGATGSAIGGGLYYLFLQTQKRTASDTAADDAAKSEKDSK